MTEKTKYQKLQNMNDSVRNSFGSRVSEDGTFHDSFDQQEKSLLPAPQEFDIEAQPENTAARAASPQQQNGPAKPKPTVLLAAILLNIVATITIVFVNKSIFSDPSFRNAQLSFASFHFFITFLTLQICSTRFVGVFERKTLAFTPLLPFMAAMCLNVILPNFSLAYSSVTFYQVVRVLLTPVVALLNFALYRKTISRSCALMLVPVCVGVAMVTYFDTKPASNGSTAVQTTTVAGVIFALSGVVASSVYTVFIGSFVKKMECTSVQLLHNLAPMGSVGLLYFVPWVDVLPGPSTVPWPRWASILLSGLCAAILNASQFVIVSGSGAVASTVVGHTKTCLIVVIGWTMSGRSATDWSIVGCVVAVAGIIGYSVIAIREKKK